MDIENLELFSEVALAGSFAAVARLRGRHASSVSRAISILESELGLRLFQRTTRQVSLTEAGQLFLARLEPLLGGLNEAKAEALAASSEPEGTLRLTVSVSFGQQLIVPLLAKYQAQFPRISLDLLMTDVNLDLIAERVDLAIRLGARPSGDFICAKFIDTRYRVCASPDYLARNGPIEVPGDISAHRSLVLPLPGFRSRWQFRGDNPKGECVTQTVAIAGDFAISNAIALRECAIAGMGPALLAHWMVGDAIASGKLIDLFPAHQVTPMVHNPAVWLVYPSRVFLAKKVRVSIDFFKAHVRRLAA